MYISKVSQLALLNSNNIFVVKWWINNSYQINPANSREALIEAREDEAEGADILMVKPALPSLDIIRLLKDQTLLPIGACQVSGEYSMIKAAGLLKMIDEDKVMMESLICMRRAGADLILTYFAIEAATILCGENKKFIFNQWQSGIVCLLLCCLACINLFSINP